ncbi:MAG TPA: APC family permease [Planctomycetota bacterium]|nr:APC family permease [Planctomycetota bacterium]
MGLWRKIIGPPRDIEDRRLFHHVSVAAFLAWVGLGSDGLSSSAYGPDEAFRTLGEHRHLALLLAVAMAATVFIISYAYSRIIEQFPTGGGGYNVATKLLGRHFGLISGSALVVDYVLTISISIASGGDAIFSFLPAGLLHFKLAAEVGAIGLLLVLNLRGVKESVTVLLPIFISFLVAHVVLILGAVFFNWRELPAVFGGVATEVHRDLAVMGFWPMFVLFTRAYALGGGTYTGIEAVSNGLQIMREPKVATGKRTMVYMATSLALTAGGILLGYLLVHAVPGKPLAEGGPTMNAILSDRVAHELHLGAWFPVVVLVTEGAILLLAAQAGFIDGPRVMANMAVDSWLPRRLAMLSDRLTMQNGILLMGGAALLVLFYTEGAVEVLVVMYSINVFLTFSLSQLGMCKYWVQHRKKDPTWRRHLPIHVVGLVLCASILALTIAEKFLQGGWITLVITVSLIAFCELINFYYRRVSRQLRELDASLARIPKEPGVKPPAERVDCAEPVAAILVGGYGGLGIHALLTVFRLFPNYFKGFVFMSVAVIDSGSFKGAEELEALRRQTEESLKKYVELARGFGFPAEYRMAVGTEVVAEVEAIALDLAKTCKRLTFFAGILAFQVEAWYHAWLHNETAYVIQRHLTKHGLGLMVLPVRVGGAPREPASAAAA